MKQRSIETADQLRKAVTDLAALDHYRPFVLTITSGKKIRSESQSKRYFANLDYWLEQISHAIHKVEENGYTNLEARNVIARELPESHAAVLYVRKAEAAHEIIKLICGIPTSTRLGTKSFMKFEDIMEQTMSEIIGEINAAVREA